MTRTPFGEEEVREFMENSGYLRDGEITPEGRKWLAPDGMAEWPTDRVLEFLADCLWETDADPPHVAEKAKKSMIYVLQADHDADVDTIIPFPGSEHAAEQGCTCPPQGKGEKNAAGTKIMIDGDCPIHEMRKCEPTQQ